MREDDVISPESERKKAQQEEAMLWMSYARDDYDVAHYLYDGDFYPKKLEIICYHCSQAAEKAVKAVIVDLGSQGGLSKIHKIAFLLNQIKNILPREKGIQITEEMMDWGDELSNYSVDVRYPNQMQIDDHRAEKAMEKMDFFVDWAQKVLEK